MNDFIPQIKARITMRDICDRYGIDVNRRGYARCVFHEEKTPSMRIYDNGSFHCFGCGATGDVIDFVRKYYDLNLQQAVVRINNDFALGLPVGRKPSAREIEEARKAEALRKRVRFAREASYWLWWERYHNEADRLAELKKTARKLRRAVKDDESAMKYAGLLAEIEYQRYITNCVEDKLDEHRNHRA